MLKVPFGTKLTLVSIKVSELSGNKIMFLLNSEKTQRKSQRDLGGSGTNIGKESRR